MSTYDPFDGKYTAVTPPPEDPPEDGDDDGDGGESEPHARRAESMDAPDAAIEVSVYPHSQLVRMQKGELQDLARQRSLSTGGTRDELIERVESAQGATA